MSPRLPLVACVLFVLPAVTAYAQTEGGDLTLPQALALVLLKNPDLESTQLDIRIAEARALQAGLRKNPEISLEIEDIRWRNAPDVLAKSTTLELSGTGLRATRDRSSESGAGRGLGESQTTLYLSQVVELGGKRVKRLRLAEKEKVLAQWSYEAKRLDVLAETTKAFVKVLSAQETLALAESNVEVARQVVSTVAARVQAGKVSPIESNKAETELASVNIAREKEVHGLESARAKLAAMWGEKTPAFRHAVGDYEAVIPVPSYEELAKTIEQNPDLARWADEMEAREAGLTSQRALRVPDLTVQLGFRTIGVQSHEQKATSFSSDGTLSYSDGDTGFSREHDNSLVLIMSVPLPLFDRNQGGIKEAEHAVAQTAQKQRSAEVAAYSGLYAAQQSLAQAYSSVVTLRDEVLPRARDTFARTQEGYNQGKFAYLDVLDAQRTLFDLQAQYVTSLADYHVAMADVERLAGSPIQQAAEKASVPEAIESKPAPEPPEHEKP